MGVLDFFKKKKTKERQLIQDIDIVLNENPIKFEELNMMDSQSRVSYIQNCCEQIVEANKELNNATMEYRMVTSYLNDIQEIENLPVNNKAEVIDLAKQIQSLSEERKTFQTAAAKISEQQYIQLEQNAEEMKQCIQDMKEREDYLAKVKGDLHHLEGERTYQISRKKQLLRNQQNMKGLSIITFFTMIITFGMLLILKMVYQMNTDIGYEIAVFIGAIAAIGIFMKMYQNGQNLRKTGKSINKVIVLLNRVKINYVNSTNAVEYLYAKYDVKNYYELNYLWEQYVAAQEEKKNYKRTAVELDYYNDQLVSILRKYQLHDPEIWVHQSEALLDEKEMIEIRHRLIVRRQNLRKRMEYNTKNQNDAKENLIKIADKYPEYSGEIERMIGTYLKE